MGAVGCQLPEGSAAQSPDSAGRHLYQQEVKVWFTHFTFTRLTLTHHTSPLHTSPYLYTHTLPLNTSLLHVSLLHTSPQLYMSHFSVPTGSCPHLVASSPGHVQVPLGVSLQPEQLWLQDEVQDVEDKGSLLHTRDMPLDLQVPQVSWTAPVLHTHTHTHTHTS